MSYKKEFRTILHGQSMLPSLSPGTWIWVKPCAHTKDRESLKVHLGDIVIFPIADCKEFVCHRVIRYNRQWVWQASEYCGSFSRIPRGCIIGKVYAWEKSEGKNQTIGKCDRFAGLIRCYRNILINHLRKWFRRSIIG